MPKPPSIFHLPSSKKIAIVHDWLVGGGAELVVLELHRMYPDAPIYTSYCTDEWRQKLDGKVVTGWLQWWPFSKLYKFLPVLRIWWFTHLKFDDYDLVISSSGNGEAKGIRVGEQYQSWFSKLLSRSTTYDLPPTKGQRPVHICYCHSPTHFYWRYYEEYLAHPKSGILNPIARLGLRILVKPLRRWDYKAAQRPDLFIANSTHIQRDIKTYYDRDSVVIYPPVDTERFSGPKRTTRHGFVTIGRQVPYKKVDIIVDACSQLGLPLTVIGKGPEHDKLVRRAGPTVRFIDNASDQEVGHQLAQAEAFILAAFEDFGITPVEALAAGTPVIAYRNGGALDYVVEGKNGIFFDKQSVESLVKTLKDFPRHHFDSQHIAKTAEKFSTLTFRQSFTDCINKL